MITKPQLTDLIRLARIGANTLGQTAQPQTMAQVWTIIGLAESDLALPETPVEQPAAADKV